MTNKIICAMLIFFLVGCVRKHGTSDTRFDNRVEKKYCVSVCVHREFGSLEQTQLNQAGLYNSVYDKCDSFYSNVDCCHHDWRNDNEDEMFKVNEIHSFEYGECIRGK